MKTNKRLTAVVVTTLICLGVIVGRAANFPAGSPDRGAPQLYAKYCGSCHGKDGRAKTTKAKFNHARNIADAAWQDSVSDERIYNSIMNGRNIGGTMPAFSKKISEQEADALVAFVRGLKK